jgi:hypothetical protein
VTPFPYHYKRGPEAGQIEIYRYSEVMVTCSNQHPKHLVAKSDRPSHDINFGRGIVWGMFRLLRKGCDVSSTAKPI